MEHQFRDDQIFVAGEWRRGRGPAITSTFAAEGIDNTTITGASAADVDEAIDKARTAQSNLAWLGLKPHERANYLYRISERINANIERIAWVQSRDTSKTLNETRALATSAAATFRYFGAVLETSDDLLTVSRGTCQTTSVHEPLGVVAAITPWNSPIASDAQKVAPALAAGNAVVLKPASWSPLVSLELARIIKESGLPTGLFSVLPGSGREVGNRLVEHPDIARVSFTGGTSTGRHLARAAAEKLMPVSLELGGKSPTIVFDDCDEDLAIADPSRLRRGGDRLDHAFAKAVLDDDLQFHLGQEVDDIFGTPIQFGMSLLPTEPLGLGHGNATHADFVQGFFYFIELEGLDDRLDLFQLRATFWNGDPCPPGTLQQMCQPQRPRATVDRAEKCARNLSSTVCAARSGGNVTKCRGRFQADGRGGRLCRFRRADAG